jgi:hypothetical protein
MKIRNAILVCTVLALFAAGCGMDGGFELPPDNLGDGDFPIVDIEDPPFDDGNGDDGFSNLRPVNPDLTVNIPVYTKEGTIGVANGVVYRADSPTVDAPVLTFAGEGDESVDCDWFSEDVADICSTISCEDKDVCTTDNDFITCSDVKEWVDGLPTKDDCDKLRIRAKRSCDTFDISCHLKKDDRKRDAIECLKQLDMKQELVDESDCFEIDYESSTDSNLSTTTYSGATVERANSKVQRSF